MILSHSEENRNKIISIAISVAIFLLLLLFLIWYTIITPNPPFPITAGGGGGTEINFGTYNEGTGNIENDGIGDAPSVVTSPEVTPSSNPSNNEAILTSDNGEDIDLTKPKIDKNTTVIVPTNVIEKPKEKTMAEKIAENALKNKGKNGGGDGNSGHSGNDGSPDGNPNTHGNGGTGGGPDTGDGPGKGPGTGPGTGGYGFSLGGRNVVSPPPLPKDTREEGKVVVEIVVDKNGNVIKADAVGRGTNTNSAMLKSLARQAAFATKFNVSGTEEQKGTITIVFSF